MPATDATSSTDHVTTLVLKSKKRKKMEKRTLFLSRRFHTEQKDYFWLKITDKVTLSVANDFRLVSSGVSFALTILLRSFVLICMVHLIKLSLSFSLSLLSLSPSISFAFLASSVDTADSVTEWPVKTKITSGSRPTPNPAPEPVVLLLPDNNIRARGGGPVSNQYQITTQMLCNAVTASKLFLQPRRSICYTLLGPVEWSIVGRPNTVDRCGCIFSEKKKNIEENFSNDRKDTSVGQKFLSGSKITSY